MSTDYLFKLAPEDEKLVASSGTAGRTFLLFESLGFMTLSYRLVEQKKLPLIPLWRQRTIQIWESNRAGATGAFEKFIDMLDPED